MSFFTKFIKKCLYLIETLFYKVTTKLIHFLTKFSLLEDIFANIISLIVLFLIVFLFILEKIDIVTFISSLTTYLLLMLAIIKAIVEKHDKSVLVSFTTKYLLEPDKSRIDDILGVLISGKLARLKINPLDDFFETLNSIADNSDYETKRRLSEALPALFQLSFKRSQLVFFNLRDDIKGVSNTDIRRRAIESLSYLPSSKTKFILENLDFKDSDEVYVVFPLIEVLNGLKKHIFFKKERIDEKYIQIKDNFSKVFPNDMNNLDIIWENIALFEINRSESLKKCTEILSTNNVFLKIFISRNYRLLCKDNKNCLISKRCRCNNQKEIISIIEKILIDNNKNVRRPLAKELSLECLCLLVKNKSIQDRVLSVLKTLFTDTDSIIRITAFDKIDNLLESKNKIIKAFAIDNLNFIKDTEVMPELRDRAYRLLKQHNMSL
ncbi:MAG: hypothetical protein PHS54_04350 [Clostridia bacterium]|nr:hypothetical protein [Clostridia bacterium]